MKKQKKILFFADRLPPLTGGVEIHGHEFIRFFTNHPLYPILHTVTQEKEPLPPQLDPQILFFNSGRWIEQLSELRRLFPQALFVYRTGGNEILKAPLSDREEPSYENRIDYWVHTLNKTIDVLITNSLFTEKRLKSIGIECPFYRCVGGAYGSKKPSKSGQSQTLFSATRFVPYKNPLLLLQVFEKVQKIRPSVSLRIAGDGPLLKAAQDLGANIPNVTLLGEISNKRVMDELAATDLYLQLSSDHQQEVPGGAYIHTEGMGRSILEAISSGIYVIAGKCGALPEILTPDRGKLIALSSKEKIVKEIVQTLDNLPSNLPGTEAYSWPRLFNRYEALYESAISH